MEETNSGGQSEGVLERPANKSPRQRQAARHHIGVIALTGARVRLQAAAESGGPVSTSANAITVATTVATTVAGASASASDCVTHVKVYPKAG